ncbi:MAG TPA: transporter [Blastocatellia bacterium]|nr:transporter [Blastocatellia bacterium]
MRPCVNLALALLLLSGAASPAQAQQPFFTDDADVTPKHKFHFEFANEFDILQKSAFPGLRQNTSSFTLNYGLLENVEIGINAPLIAIFNDRGASPRAVFGVGDINISAKYNFRQERPGSRLPAMTVSLNLELPTGDKDRLLGSALTDFAINGIFQKSLTERAKLRVNSGVLFYGNTLTGAIGVRARGTVFTGGASLVREFTSRLQLGAEVTGAATPDLDLGQGQLQFQVGGNYAVGENWTLDFGVIGGRFAASPRAGLQLGVSIDF